MLKKTFKFAQTNAFIGLAGKHSPFGKLPITQLGAVTFNCREVVDYGSENRTWRDNMKDFYDEYDILIIACGTLVTLLLTCFLCCCCWIKCKKDEIKRL